MFVIEDLGVALTTQKITPGNTATGLGAEFYKYTQRKLPFTSGGATEIVAGDWIVGATSAAKACVVSVTLDSGTWATEDAAGTLIIKCQHGTFQSEKIVVGAGTDDATITANSRPMNVDYPFKGMLAKAALFTVKDNTSLVAFDGAKPDQTSLIGVPMVANSSLTLKNIEAIKNFKCIDYTSGSVSVLNIVLFF